MGVYPRWLAWKAASYQRIFSRATNGNTIASSFSNAGLAAEMLEECSKRAEGELTSDSEVLLDFWGYVL
jgi:hypothetical protein